MIAVIGRVAYRPSVTGTPDAAVGLAAAIAGAAALRGAAVEIVTKIGDDAPGDELLVALSRQKVGHAAVLRDAEVATHVTSPFTASAEPESDLDIDLLELIESDLDLETALDPATGAPELEPADVEMALRYLSELEVIVVADPIEAGVAQGVADAARYAEAQVIAVVSDARPFPVAIPNVTVFDAPEEDPEGRFAQVVGAYAAGLASGREPSDAFDRAVGESGFAETSED
jgi:sugar/nucleoside kinase (ribokinase family)